MQDAGTVLEVLRERGRKGLPCDELYRQMFNKSLYLLAYGNIYSNQGAMTPGPGDETADGMSEAKIDQIIALMRAERYRFAPVRRVLIPKKNGKRRPLGLPSWSDKLVAEVVRLLLEAYYEPQFSGRSHGFRPGRDRDIQRHQHGANHGEQWRYHHRCHRQRRNSDQFHRSGHAELQQFCAQQRKYFQHGRRFCHRLGD